MIKYNETYLSLKIFDGIIFIYSFPHFHESKPVLLQTGFIAMCSRINLYFQCKNACLFV